MKANFVAKHMNTFNCPSVVENKRDKHLDDLYDQELNEELLELGDFSCISCPVCQDKVVYFTEFN